MMWQATAKGGTLIIGNLSDNTGSIGYAEAIMDWWMILRSYQQMQELAEHLAHFGNLAVYEIHQIGCFYYLKATKAI